ncbi:Ig-like domain-containing protein [Nitrincola sp. MINF-07-Sa-05]|uniref:Ig-like domain-containing protein n=1 Tax=Nitrincola salilacus TaxID=3400273 RepID=UPI003917DE02
MTKDINKKIRKSFNRNRHGMMRLEPRVMFDGAGAVDAIAVMTVDDVEHYIAPPAVGDAEVIETTEIATDFSEVDKQARESILAFLDGDGIEEKFFAVLHGNQSEPSAEWLDRGYQLFDLLNDNEYAVNFRFLDNAQMSGLLAAFAAEGPGGEPTIIINIDWWNQSDSEQRLEVLVEEYGHSFDHFLNLDVDTAGDEGKAFAIQVLELPKDAQADMRIAGENDHYSILLDGQSYAVEAAGGSSPVISFPTTAIVNDYSIVTSTDQGFTVTARQISDGQLSEVSAEYISIVNSFPFGFGVKGPVSNGADGEIGYDHVTGLSEELIIDFDNRVPSVDVKIAWMSASESASYTLYLNGEVVQAHTILNDTLNVVGTDQIDGPFTIQADNGSPFDRIVFSAPGVNDDYLINEISFPRINSVTAQEDATFEFTDGNALSVSDSDGDVTSVSLDVNHGTLNVILSGGASISEGANDSDSLTISGTQTEINATLATLKYQSNVDYNGPDTLTVIATDSTDMTDTVKVPIIVSAVQDAFDDTASTTSGQSVNIDVLANDEFEGSPVTVTAVSQPANGTVVNNNDGTVTYTPDASFIGTDTFTYTARTPDGVAETATVTVTVGENPTVIDGDFSGTGGEDTDITGTLTATDDDGLAATPFTVTSLPGNGTASIDANGNWTYTPDDDWHGADSFTVTVTDALGNATTQVINITVSPEQDAFNDTASTTSGQSVDIDVLVNDEFEGTPVTVTAVSQPANGTVVNNNDGTVTYTPDASFVGTDTFTYTARTPDGVAETATVTVTVGENPTVIDGDFSGTGGEDTDITGTLTATDDDGLAATPFTVTSLPNNGTASIDANGNWTYTPDDDWHGADSFTVTVTDALGNATTQVINITVSPEQDAFNDTASTTSGQSVDIDVLVNDEFEGSPVTVTAVSQPANGTVVNNNDGTVTYTPDASFIGTDTFTYTARTPDGVAETATVTVTVGENPTVIDGDFSGTGGEDTDITGTLTATDDDGLAATPFTVTSLPGNGTASIDANGNWTYTPDDDWHGADSFTVTVTDALGNATTQVINITVSPEQDAFNDTASTTSGQSVDIDVLVNDEFEGSPVTVTAVSQPANGTVVNNNDGTVTYTPDASFIGTDTFTYTARTPDGVAETATVTVTVQPQPLLPEPIAPQTPEPQAPAPQLTPQEPIQSAPESSSNWLDQLFDSMTSTAPWDSFNALFTDVPTSLGEEHQLTNERNIPDLNIGDNGEVRFTIPADTFGHTDPQAIIDLTATMVDGTPLPSWLRFDPATGQISGTAPEDYQGELQVRVVARDDAGRQAETLVRVSDGSSAPRAGQDMNLSTTVTPESSVVMASSSEPYSGPTTSASGFAVAVDSTQVVNGEHLLKVARAIPDQMFAAGSDQLLFIIPTDAFVHTDSSARVALHAELVDGTGLPDWLEFDPEKGEFRGVPPEGFEGELLIKVIARDQDGREAETLVRVRIQQVSAADSTGRAGLIALMQDEGLMAWKAERDDLIRMALLATGDTDAIAQQSAQVVAETSV